MLNVIKEIKFNLSNKAYQSALVLSLTLPSICAKVEYGNDSRTDYKNWCDNHIPKDKFLFGMPGFEGNELTGEVIYQLRCAVLHSGNTIIPKEYGLVIDSFSLWVNEKDAPNFGYEYSRKTLDGKTIYGTKIDLIYLVETLCDCAEQFYTGKRCQAPLKKNKLSKIFINENRDI